MQFLEILKVVLLGIIEGVTEWLPVSSTGHMILFDHFFPLKQSEEFVNMFEVVIQFGAILAVVVLFWNKLFPFAKKTDENNLPQKGLLVKKNVLLLWAKVLIACVPAGVVGILFDDWMEEHLHTPAVIAATLIVYGAAFIVVEKLNKNRVWKTQEVFDITFRQALIIGAAQILSLIPGTSRSGVTILCALIIGISRPAGSEFTFFLGVPVMAGASLIKTLKFFLDHNTLSGAEIGYLLIGCVVAFAVSMLAIKALMGFVKKHSFIPFGIYRIVLGIGVLSALVIPYL
jgi:undecaprenyl-diphosphatase